MSNKLPLIRINTLNRNVFEMSAERHIDMVPRMLNVSKGKVLLREVMRDDIPFAIDGVVLGVACVRDLAPNIPGWRWQWEHEYDGTAGNSILFGSANGGVCAPPITLEFVKQYLVWTGTQEEQNERVNAQHRADVAAQLAKEAKDGK